MNLKQKLQIKPIKEKIYIGEGGDFQSNFKKIRFKRFSLLHIS